jgi:hypothetical protein
MSLSSGDNPKAGTLTISSATALPNNPCISVLVQADPATTHNLLVGDSNSQPINLAAGQAISIPCSNTNLVYVNGNGGSAIANWLAIR